MVCGVAKAPVEWHVKILFINALADPKIGGGAEVIVWEQISGLLRAGHECALLATSSQAGLKQIKMNGIPVWLAGIRNLYWPYDNRNRPAALRMIWHTIDIYNPLMLGYMRQVIQSEHPDVISMHNLPGWSVAAWAIASRLGVPAVQVLHDTYSLCPNATMYKKQRNCSHQCANCRLFRLPHRALSNRLSAVVGVSQYILDRHVTEGYFNKVPIRRVIHNARDIQNQGIDHQPTTKHSGIRFGYVGRLAPPKGIGELIDAFRSVTEVDSELWIAGTGKAMVEAELRARTHGDMRIRFVGRVTPKELYPYLDVLVVPSSWQDTLPSVVFEALAYGKPVIGSRRGGIPEMIRQGENGLLFDPDKHGDLLATLQWFNNSASFRSSVGQAAIESAKPFLDTVACTQKYLQVYGDVMGTHLQVSD